jgi:hypothetical protein
MSEGHTKDPQYSQISSFTGLMDVLGSPGLLQCNVITT